jgi:hypothetical protein
MDTFPLGKMALFGRCKGTPYEIKKDPPKCNSPQVNYTHFQLNFEDSF